MRRARRIAVGIAVVTTVLATSLASWAGKQYASQVFIHDDDREAIGALGSARNSGDGIQEIGCLVSANFIGAENVYCFAKRVLNSTFRSCSSSDPKLVDIAKGQSDSSRLVFEWSASNGACEYIEVTHASWWEPKAP